MGAELVEPSLGVSSENQAADSYRTDLSGLSDLSSILALRNKGEAPLRQRVRPNTTGFDLPKNLHQLGPCRVRQS